MNTAAPTTPPANVTPFARNVLTIAAEVEASELAIKNAIMSAARAGDTATVIALVQRWIDLPPADVLADMSASTSPRSTTPTLRIKP